MSIALRSLSSLRPGIFSACIHARDNRPGRGFRTRCLKRPQAAIRCVAAFTGRRYADEFRRHPCRNAHPAGHGRMFLQDGSSPGTVPARGVGCRLRRFSGGLGRVFRYAMGRQRKSGRCLQRGAVRREGVGGWLPVWREVGFQVGDPHRRDEPREAQSGQRGGTRDQNADVN